MKTTWEAAADPEIQQFLGDSELCDLHHPLIQAVTGTLVGDAGSQTNAATAIHRFVRDGIAHRWVPMGQMASVTLERRAGDCWPKSILQVAMLRAANIPARFRWLEYYKKLFEGLVPTAVYESLSDPFPFHVLAEAFLEDRWVRADATFDRDLCPDRALDWDGRTDIVALQPDEISRDLGFTTSFEERIPDIKRFFASDASDDGSDQHSQPDLDVESEVVNLHFDLVRLRNRFDDACGVLLRGIG